MGGLSAGRSWPEAVNLSLIGDFELRCAGKVIDIAPNSQRLISFLALQGSSVRRSYVSGTLWVDATDSRASASMRSALWRLPASSRGDIVEVSSTHIWLHPDVQVDLARLTAMAIAVLDHRIAEEKLVEAARELTAFGDNLLPGWYDDWVVVERENFRQLRLHALDQLGDQLLASHRYCDALQVGLASVAAEPLRESAHRLLMRAHLCEGNIAEAIRQYRSFAGLLADELGVRPSATMAALLRQCTGDVAAQPAVQSAEPASAQAAMVFG
jgi:DNA-binding SARP family transcriptional activator